MLLRWLRVLLGSIPLSLPHALLWPPQDLIVDPKKFGVPGGALRVAPGSHPSPLAVNGSGPAAAALEGSLQRVRGPAA